MDHAALLLDLLRKVGGSSKRSPLPVTYPLTGSGVCV